MAGKKEILSEREYWFWYCGIYQPVPGLKERLLKKMGSPKEIFHASDRILQDFFRRDGYTNGKEKMLRKILEGRQAEKIRSAYREMEQKEITLITIEDEEYPKHLRLISGSPLGLFVKGKLPDEKKPAAAIVGSRDCSFYGSAMAERLGKALSEAGVQVISGLAKGIDSAGHRGALADENGKGSTYGILGCGIDVIYPPENRALYEEIEKNGGIISEYPPGTPPLPANFPARNRIISGLSDCIAVIEAGKKSGSLITASYALDQGKDIWAVPGRAGDYLSFGTNSLLRDGAHILTEPEDMLSFWNLNKIILKNYEKIQLSLDKKQEMVYSCLDSEPKSMEEICAVSGLESRTLAECLLDLELEGLVVQPFPHYYAAKRNKGEHYGKVSGHRGIPRESQDN